MSLETTVRLRKKHNVYNPTYAISAKNKHTTYTTQPKTELTKKSEIYSSTFCSTLGWHSTYRGFKTRGTHNAIGRRTHIPLPQVQEDLPCLHFHKYNRNLRQDGTKSCSEFIIILISYLFILLFKYIQTVIINCILLWIPYICLNVRLYILIYVGYYAT